MYNAIVFGLIYIRGTDWVLVLLECLFSHIVRVCFFLLLVPASEFQVNLDAVLSNRRFGLLLSLIAQPFRGPD